MCIWLQKQQKNEGEWKKVEVLIAKGGRRQIGPCIHRIQVN